jgi:hypothetical protein
VAIFLVGDSGLKASSYSVGCDFSDFSFIRVVLTAFPGEECDLKMEFLHKTLDFLLVDAVPLIFQFACHAAIAIIFVTLADLKDLLFNLFIWILSVEALLPIHVGCFGHACV